MKGRGPGKQRGETAETQSTGHAATGVGAPARRYLAVFEPGSSRVFDLPETGEVVVGRGSEATLRVADAKISRRHVRIVLSPRRAELVDLGSQNGTLVNGERLVDPRALVSGDVVEMSQTALVFHAPRAAAAERGLEPFEAWREAAARELDRATIADRPLSVLALLLDRDPDASALVQAVRGSALGLESVAHDGPQRALVALPDVDDAQALAAGHELVRVLERIGVGARAGVASQPADGCDVDTLLTSARAAALAAAPRGVETARRTFRVVRVGEHDVLLADPAMIRLYALIERLAGADLPVLVHGETGSGKELAAVAVHHFSPRRSKRLVTLNCAALHETLVESELFGHERGAFTGAATTKPGLLEVAAGGTVFLDEVGELAAPTQAKLLRALDAKKITRVGDVHERAIDVRVVAATNRDLSREVAAGRFRSDLYYRLSGATVWVPPLRDRPRELGLLSRRFLDDACARAGRPPMRISDDAQRMLARHAWPGNIRELRHLLEFVVAAFPDPVLEPWHIESKLGPPVTAPAADAPPAPAPPPPLPAPRRFLPLEEEIRRLEKTRIEEAMNAAGGNQRRAAQLIAMPLRTFVSKLAQHGLRARDG